MGCRVAIAVGKFNPHIRQGMKIRYFPTYMVDGVLVVPSLICRENRNEIPNPCPLSDRFHPCDGRQSAAIPRKIGKLGNICVLKCRCENGGVLYSAAAFLQEPAERLQE